MQRNISVLTSEEVEDVILQGLTSELPNMATNLVGSTWQLRR